MKFIFVTALAITALSFPSSLAADPFAKAVIFSEILNGNSGNSQPDPLRILGAPNGLEVSLGGPGASIIVDMGADTAILNGPGPDLEIREIGAAFGGVDESYRVLVSNSTDTNTFILVGQGRALSLIDIAPAGLPSARYVWLQDLATETLNTSTPGSDIDSVRTIHYSGSSEDLPPPTGLAVRATSQGARISWTPSTAPNVTGYAIRRSLDGISFGSTPDYTTTARETAVHDSNLPRIGPVYYSVSTITSGGESALVVVSLPATEYPIASTTAHLGDDVVDRWEVPAPQRELRLTFDLAGFPAGPQAELLFDLWDVDNNSTPILLNGARIGAVPVQAAESWAPATFRFPTGHLLPGPNTLIIGGAEGTLDDFLVRNIRLNTFGVLPGGVPPDLITTARFTDVLPGQTTLTLRWVVQQTPTLSPPAWQTVSDPIEWIGNITFNNGFYRLQEAP